MSLLIKALDKAQAEKKAQATEANNALKAEQKKNKPSKSKKKTKAEKHKKVKVAKQTAFELETSNINDQKLEQPNKNQTPGLTLSPPKENIVTAEPDENMAIPDVLKESAAVKAIEKKAKALSIGPTERVASLASTSSVNAKRKPNAITPTVDVETDLAPKVSSKPIEKLTPKILPPLAKPIPSQSNAVVNKSEEVSSERAANVFTVKQTDKAIQQNSMLPIIVGAAFIALIALAVYYYQFIDYSPEIVIPPRNVVQRTSVESPVTTNVIKQDVASKMASQSTNNAITTEQAELDVSQVKAGVMQDKVAPKPAITEQVIEAGALALSDANQTQTNELRQTSIFTTNTQGSDIQNNLTENSLAPTEEIVARKNNGLNQLENEPRLIKLDKVVLSESASIEVTKNKSENAISPLLMEAYEAYNTGNDDLARESYKNVLRKDSLNIDAMLGLAAISTRQKRNSDANGWYRKVLSLAPRNATAQSGLLFIQDQSSAQVNVSKIKSMLAVSPSDASLYVALGNSYGGKNEWGAAQQAYFEAYRLNQSAENAYNLGISLDQLNKPKLALPYYQEALAKIAQLNTTAIDQAGLEARIAVIDGS